MKKRDMKKISTVTFLSKNKLFLIVLILLLSFLLLGPEFLSASEDAGKSEGEYAKHSISFLFENDPTINLLGKSFFEITQIFGEPAEKGYSEIFGPHQYLLYENDEGFIRFTSPEYFEDEVVASIILGEGQEVMDVTIGMPFCEIIDILGPPDFGPEMGIDDLYYIEYYSEEINGQMPETFISFAAPSMDSSTEFAFIKKEDVNLE